MCHLIGFVSGSLYVSVFVGFEQLSSRQKAGLLFLKKFRRLAALTRRVKFRQGSRIGKHVPQTTRYIQILVASNVVK